jgi:hypothetical protein
MVDRTPFSSMLTLPEVRKASLWALAGAVAAFVIGPLLTPYAASVAEVVAIVGFVVMMWKLVRIVLGSPGWRPAQPGEYDEREIAERYRALAESYLLLTALLPLGWSLYAFGRAIGWAVPSFHDLPAGLSFVLVFVLWALPGIFLAWRNRRLETAEPAEDRAGESE